MPRGMWSLQAAQIAAVAMVYAAMVSVSVTTIGLPQTVPNNSALGPRWRATLWGT